MKQDEFIIKVKNVEYSVEQLQACNPRKYRINKAGNYLFTIHETEFGGWLIDDIDVISDTEILADFIGDAIKCFESPSWLS